MKNTTFISLTPNSLNEAGHDFIYHRCLEEICSQLGISFRALAARASSIALPNQWSGFFRSRKYRVIDFAKAFLFCEKNQKRIFFIESFNTVDFFSLCLAGLFFAKHSDSIWVFFRYGKNQLPKNGMIHLFLAKILRYRFGKRFVALTDSELIRNSFALDLPLHVMPIPHTEVLGSNRRAKESISLWWPGAPRASKGLKEIQDLIQLSAPISMELTLAKGAKLPSTIGMKLNPIQDVLTREEYLSQMQKSDLILLPYDPAVYSMGTSGILIEAIIAGKIPVVKEGSWLSYELKRYGLDALVIDWSKDTLIDTLLNIYKDKSIGEQLSKMRQDYLQFHSLSSYRGKFASLILS